MLEHPHPLGLLWAKARPGRPTEFHPLVCHSIDVASVALALWGDVFRAHLKHQLSSALDVPPPEAGRWLAFWAGAHDLGKACPAFQAKNAALRAVLERAGLPFPPLCQSAPHNHVTARVLPDLLAGATADPAEAVRPAPVPTLTQPLARRIATAVGGHHGTFPRAQDVVRLSRASLGGSLWAEARRRVFEQLALALGAQALTSPQVTLDRDHAFFLLLAGLTSVADWIGSSEEYFGFASPDVDLTAYVGRAQNRACNALRELGWTGWKVARQAPAFRTMFGFPPRRLQHRATELAREVAQPALVIIEAPMGEGKTEAALYLSRWWSTALGQKGCYVALPTQATSDQMFHRVREFLATQYPSQKVNLQLLHGRATLSEEFQQLRLSAIQDEEGPPGDEQGNVVAEEWFTPKKRGLLAPFAVGTVDQALLAVLQTRHSFVRLFGLACKTVIIDEVHAYDTYMSSLLERLLAWLHVLGCTVVMLSATLPAERRRRLLAAFGSGADAPPDVPYPRISWAAADRSGAVALEAEQRLARDVELRWVTAEANVLAATLSRTLGDGGCAVCICNTVGRAQEVYAALRGVLGDNECALLHSRFPYDERDVREEKVTSLFGKDNTRRPRRAVLVATQIVEQSLDVDFDLMVTETAPVDLVIQRAGRLHRHLDNADGTRRQRPDGVREPQLWLMKPAEGPDGIPDFGPTAFVYARCTLLRSYLALCGRETIRLPDDIEALVELAYGEEQHGGLPRPWQEALAAARDELGEEMERAVWVARNNVIKSPHDPDDILEAFCKQLHEDDPSVHDALRALTRLAKPSVQIVCLEGFDDGLRLRASDATPLDLDTPPSMAEAKALLRRSLSVSHAGLVGQVRHTEVPAGWRQNALLRHHRPLVLTEGEAVLGHYSITLDPELGMVVVRNDGAQEGGTP